MIVRFLVFLALASNALGATTGVVFSSSGEPLAGARVTARRIETSAERRARLATLAEEVTLATTETSREGTFSLDVKESGVLELLVERDGYAPDLEQVLSGDTDLVVTLTAAPMRTGHVTAHGKPVANALTIAMTAEGAVFSTRTDEHGAYAMPDPGTWCTGLVILHPDFAPFVGTRGDFRLPLDAALESGRDVAGSVLAPNGKPQAAARVTADGWREVLTAADGTFTLRHVAASAKVVSASSGTSIGSAPARAKNTVVNLEARHAITGTVRDGAKHALAGAIVSAYRVDAPDGIFETARTDAKGNYELPNCQAARYGVFASATRDTAFETAEAKLQNVRSVRLDFDAKPVTSLHGMVVDERRHPVAGALVQWLVSEMPIIYGSLARSELASAQSGGDGRFRLSLPMDDRRLATYQPRVQALRRGYAVGISSPLKAGETLPSTLTITLPDGIPLSGIIRDPDGKPVSGAAILLIQDPYGAAPLPADGLLASNTLNAFITSDANGAFSLALNDAPHDIGVWKEGFAGFREGGIRPNAKGRPLEIVLDRGVEIRGRVTRKGSTVPFEGTVMARGEDASFAIASVAPDGAFVLHSLREGTYTVAFSDGHGGDVERMIKAPADGVELDLGAVGTIHGHVVDKETGDPILSYEISTRDSGGDFATPMTEEDGAFTARTPPGSTEVTVHAEGYVAESTTVTVDLVKTAEITVALTHGRALRGRVLTEDGLPVSGARVSIENASTQWQNAETDDAGEFALTGVTQEPSKVDVQKTGFVSRKYDVEAGNTDVRMDMVLSRGGKASGRVLTSAGAPVEGATVWVSGKDTQQTQTAADGTFSVEGLSGTRFRFRASRDDLGSADLENPDITREVILTIKVVDEWGSVHGSVKGFKEGKWMYGAVSAEGSPATSPISRDGTYRLEHVAAGDVQLRATAMSMSGEASTSPVKATVLSNNDIEVNLAFRTDVVIRGVVTEGSTPAAGRRIRFSGQDASASATTGEDGSYSISSLEPGMYDVYVASGSTSFDTRYEVLSSATFDIHIDRATIQGRVVDEAGAPLSHVKIALSSEESGYPTSETETDGGGTFSLSTFRGTYIVTATLKGYATAAQPAEPDSPPLVLRLVRSSGLRVRLLDVRDGHTLDGYVMATDAAGMHLAREHDAQTDGAILVPLAAGSYRVSASSDGYATRSATTDVPREGELRIALTPGGTLIVQSESASHDIIKLVEPDGEEYVRCECNGIAEIRLTGATTTIEHVAPGAYTMHVLDAQRRIKTSQAVTIAEGQTSSVTID